MRTIASLSLTPSLMVLATLALPGTGCRRDERGEGEGSHPA